MRKIGRKVDVLLWALAQQEMARQFTPETAYVGRCHRCEADCERQDCYLMDTDDDGVVYVCRECGGRVDMDYTPF